MKQIISNKQGLQITASKQIAMRDITHSGQQNYVVQEYLFKYLPVYSPEIVYGMF